MAEQTHWRCEVCGYVHEGRDPPASCPVCGVGSEMFSQLEMPRASSPVAAPRAWRCTVCGYVHQAENPPDRCPVCFVDASLFVAHEVAEKPAAADSRDEPIVIVGGGGAGLAAAESARRHTDASILLIHKEPTLPYNRLNLTRFLAGELPEEELPLKAPSWYAEQRIELLHGDVAQLDARGCQLQLRDGRTLRYERLILANGAHPFIPPIPGAARSGVLPLRTLAQAQSLLRLGRRGARCLCIGGGLLGLETAAALNARGAAATVLEGFEWLLPRQLAQPAGELVKQHLEQLGITVQCGVQVAEIVGDEEVRGVRLGTEVQLPADLVVLATGVRPNSYLARQSGLEVKRGVIVDDGMRTSDPRVLAAGDVAEHRGIVYGLWPIALEQGAVAGANAAGADRSFCGAQPANQLKVLDLPVFSVGQHTPADATYDVVEHRDGNAYRHLVCHDGALVGANLIGDLRAAGAIKSAIETGQQLAELPELLQQLPELRQIR